jgi:hypothetical protein
MTFTFLLLFYCFDISGTLRDPFLPFLFCFKNSSLMREERDERKEKGVIQYVPGIVAFIASVSSSN